MKHHHDKPKTWTDRTQSADFTPVEDLASASHGLPKQSFHKASASMGATHSGLGIAGHIVHMAGVFVPLIAGELVTDATKYKKTVRLASIGTALAYESLYVWKEAQRKEEQAAKLAECRSRE